MRSFIAFDVETATSNNFSICQIGYVKCQENTILDCKSYLIQPPNNEYSFYNTRIHGINSLMTKESPFFPEIWRLIKDEFSENVLIAHNADFDIGMLKGTLSFYKIPIPNLDYVCTYKMSRLNLVSLCQALSIELINHHDAYCDALACALAYIQMSDGINPNYTLIHEEKKDFLFKGHDRLTGNVLKPELENANKNHILYSKKIVFTGVLNNLSREEAAKIAKDKGADIDTAISKRTNFVVVGRDAGPSKLQKINELNEVGHNIKMLNENDFLDLVK